MVALSRSASLKTGFQNPVHASWPASEHTEPLNTMIINRRRFLDRLRLGPRWHAIQQHLFDRVITMPFYRRSYWIPGSYAPALSEKRRAFLRSLKKKGFKE